MLLTTDELWTLTLAEDNPAERSPSARFWLQSIGWLAQREDAVDEDAPLLAIWTDRTYYEPGEAVEIRARWRKPAEGKPWGQASGEIRRGETPAGALEPGRPDDAGEMRMTFQPPGDGRYRLSMEGTRGRESIDLEASFLVGRPERERERSGLNATLLREVARWSGGGYYNAHNAGQIPQAIARASHATRRIEERDLTDSPWAFAAFCALVGAQWIIRRRRSLI
jgi:hypothetical protein